MKIVAVVVTYNRLHLLKNCIEALLEQGSLDSILIVDNNSSDDTKCYVEKIQQKNSKIVYQKLDKNIGGAGGFSFGIEYAFKFMDGDCVWLMDDDGIPVKNSLDEMVIFLPNYQIINAIVLNENNDNELAFNLSSNGFLLENLMDVSKINQNFIPGEVSPFNSTLISRSVYEKIGLPNKHYFIWGDETEYILRAKRNGIKMGTATNAFHRHPMKKNDTEKVLFGIFGITDAKRDWKYYWFVRNKLDYMPVYYGWMVTIRWLIIEFIKNLCTFKFNAVLYMLKALFSLVRYRMKKGIENYA